MKMISSILAMKWLRCTGVFLLAITVVAASDDTAHAFGVGTWNEETQAVMDSGTGTLRYSFRAHIVHEIKNPEVAQRLREWLASPTADVSRKGIAGVIRSLRCLETPEALTLIADDFEDDGKSAWRVRLYFDRNVSVKNWNIELTLEVPLVVTEFDAVRAYTTDRANTEGRAILTRKFSDAAARKVLGLGSSDAGPVATR